MGDTTSVAMRKTRASEAKVIVNDESRLDFWKLLINKTKYRITTFYSLLFQVDRRRQEPRWIQIALILYSYIESEKTFP